ncbi:hypothetical protein L0P88_19985 [Muricauda sp. SCSIO 64092]|uniref:hypothetical protein n=1 Tax=Allomuricauda sp. SCSIO 64092 TaxID=2908842 RepID=UPI001FF16E78|nr:hypothetical protein [Muricauda sp. SCSIO 64092]UOY06192.1 hypothetical protein L0P88_19985 [Muricauda sp. SCSIO 64092]
MKTKATFKMGLVTTFVCLLSIIPSNVGCSNDSKQNSQEMLNDLVGLWGELSPCESCSTIRFQSDRTILWNLKPHDTLRMSFTIVNTSSIRVTRHWNVGDERVTNLVNVNFRSKDTLELSQFIVTDALSTTGFKDIVLIKQ